MNNTELDTIEIFGEDMANNAKVEKPEQTQSSVYRKEKTQKKKMPFSKKMYLYNILLVTCITIVSFVLIMLSGRLGMVDLSPISVIVTSSYAELGVHSGFYIWKAKYENGRKYRDVNLIQNLESDVNC